MLLSFFEIFTSSIIDTINKLKGGYRYDERDLLFK